MARFVLLLLAWLAPVSAFAQDLEPRRWTHLPVASNVAGVSYLYTSGDVLFDPVLQLDDVTVESHSAIVSYLRTFELLGATGRLDMIVPVQSTRWEGRVSGAPASRDVDGVGDPQVRLSFNFVGSPALSGADFKQYRMDHPAHTIVGAALVGVLPLGEYDSDRLLNIGQNRFIVRPQLGVVHLRGPWSYELTTSADFFTDNHDFFGGNELEQDPVFAAQAHVVRTLPNNWWVSVGTAYSTGGESAINGVDKDDERRNFLAGASVGFSLSETQGLKLAYLHGKALEDVGADTDSLLLSWTLRF
jgi:hypothetical protein